MMLLIDSREQLPLEFPKMVGVESIVVALPVGDYSAIHKEVRDLTVIERKSVPDLFHSFTSEYDAERAKILKAKELGLKYIVAIEATMLEILKGHAFWKDGQMQEHKCTGISMVKKLMTIQRKYEISIWFCSSRREMAMRIQCWCG